MASGIVLSLTACGGGGGSGGGSGSGGSSGPQVLEWQAGVYYDSDTYKSSCESPRTSASPITGEVYDDVSGSTLEENFWLRSWINETYLWYNEVDDLNPASYDDPVAYFDLLKTDIVTASGKDKDEYHFT